MAGAPYGELGLKVLATLSDGEEAEVAAMKAVWSGVPHQICQMHALGNMARPIRAGDDRLKQALADSLGKLPPVPGSEETAQARPQARTLDVVIPPTDACTGPGVAAEPAAVEGPTGTQSETSATRLAHACPGTGAVGQAPTGAEAPAAAAAERDVVVRLPELELQFRKAFRDALRRSSGKPSTFGGLAGYGQLQSLVCALQFQLSPGGSSYLHTLLEQGQRTLEETAELAQDVRQAWDYLQQVTHLLAVPLETETATPQPAGSDSLSTAEQPARGQQVKQALEDQLATWADQPQLGPVTQAFLANTQRLLTKWDADLFHCYEIPGLPPGNTDLEALFGRLRRGQRRISGRKKTSELRRTGHFQVLLCAPTLKELWQALCKVPLSAYQAARQRLEAAEERQRWLYRLYRWPAKTAAALVAEYLDLRHRLKAGMPAGP